MYLKQLKYKNHQNKYVYIEDWMSFSIKLAHFVKMYNNPINLYISVPSNLLFSYFFILGAVDYDYQNPSKEKLLSQYLNLKNGQRIHYKTYDKWVAHSVIEVGKSPVEDVRAIIVKDRLNSITYIPETKWFSNVRISGDEITEIRNTRIVKESENLVDSMLLRRIYTEYNLTLLMKQNTPSTFINVNKKEWYENMSFLKFLINGNYAQLSDFIYDGTKGNYQNISYRNLSPLKCSRDSIEVNIGCNRSLNNLNKNSENKIKTVYIIDEHDSSEKIEELKTEIIHGFMQGYMRTINNDINEFFKSEKVYFPNGVEIFAWIPKN